MAFLALYDEPGTGLAVSARSDFGSSAASLAPSRLHIRLVEVVNDTVTEPSSGDISPVGQTRPAEWNALAFRRSFPAAWSQYLRATYRTAYAVEKAFQIDSKTARDWINGKRDPSGSFVAAVVKADPNAMKILGGNE